METQPVMLDMVHGNRVLVRQGDPPDLYPALLLAGPACSLDPRVFHAICMGFLRYVCHRGVGRLEIHMRWCWVSFVSSRIEGLKFSRQRGSAM